MPDIAFVDKAGGIDPLQLKKPVSLLPIKHAVLLPGVVLPITITRKKSMQLIKKVHEEDGLLAVITQQISQKENHKPVTCTK